MRPEDILDAIGNTDDDLIEKADQIQSTSMRRKSLFAITVAATLSLIILAVALLIPDFGTQSHVPNTSTGAVITPNISTTQTTIKAPQSTTQPPLTTAPAQTEWKNAISQEPIANADNILAEAKYPVGIQYAPNGDGYAAWVTFNKEMSAPYRELNVNIDSFIRKAISTFLSGQEGKNAVISPVSIYITFAMLAEITDGNSRDQILDALGCDTIETLRQTASALWKAHYQDDGLGTTLLANSLWLSDEYTYQKETMKILAENYFASSYTGEMGSDEFNKLLQKWLDVNTGGQLTDQAAEVQTDRNSVIALVNTIFYQSKWCDIFSESNTETGIFHAPSGDESCDFMKQPLSGQIYTNGQFSAICMAMAAGGKMWFILPNEDIKVEELLTQNSIMDLVNYDLSDFNYQSAVINFSLPKFDVSSKTDLKAGMQKLGMTDIFDEFLSDFTNTTTNVDNIIVTDALHSARVTVDEEGCTAAAFTVAIGDGEGMPSNVINFTLDRPFLFVITSNENLPLFVGTVNEPNA